MEDQATEKKWKPIGRVLRRVAGVLVEKAKTTPDIYPMTINAITTAANQKSNRSPQMQLTVDEVDEALDDLREIHAVVEIQGDGRKSKYKHLLYEWLGVDKVELAVMGELLLRGQQTLGELRARASRMERIEGLNELKPIVKSLIEKRLVIELTPAGRGQIITHALYQSEELAKLEKQVHSGAFDSPQAAASEPTSTEPSKLENRVQALEQLVSQLSERVSQLESDIRG